ncbi:MAG: 8-amino-7-oxononanoate synthase [Zetaproteobacteria bacterium]|nr:MAG: 8-amino-7-oxononanoate synthase [Zetaproteobacteria bacterium]
MASSMPVMPDSCNWFDPVATSRRRVFTRSQRLGVWIEIDGVRLLNFSSNDYLGLSFHPAVQKAAIETIRHDGFGSGASRLVSGDDPLLHELEDALVRWKGYEAALVMGSGMLANIGLLNALAERGTHLFCDKLNHASLVDGARLARSTTHRYAHLDLVGLERLLEKHRVSRRIIVSDGVFSMDGDCADVHALMQLADAYDALVVLDDAHGLGTVGPGGCGLAAEAGVQGHARLIEVGTCGKALGAYGAFILGSSEMIEGLRQRCRTMIYSTALPPCAPSAALASLKVLQEENLSQRLQENVKLFLHLARQAGLPLVASRTPIQPLILGSDEAALQASSRLREHGFFVSAIRPPAVPERTARLRITLSAAHEAEHIKNLVKALVMVINT